MLEEIRDKENTSEAMSEAWDNGSPEEAAMCDPSDQYMLECEIEELWKEFKQVVNKEIRDDQ